PGINSFGRNASNDFQIPDDSVSASHCQIELRDHSAILKDLGSTNGTFVDGTLTTETELRPGQTIHLGSVELTYFSDEQASPYVRQTVPPRAEFSPEATPALVQTPRTTRIPLPPERELPSVSTSPSAAPVSDAGTCRFHPKTPGRYFCPNCRHHFCELCVTSR